MALLLMGIADSVVMASVQMDEIDQFLERSGGELNLSLYQKHAIRASDPNAWFNQPGNNILTPPPYDRKKVIEDPKFASHPIVRTIYYNSETRSIYVLERGGIADEVRWYGPIEIKD